MRFVLFFLFSISILISCNDIQDNSPAFQGEVDNVFFKALDTQIIQNEDGTFTIQGISLEETVTLKIASVQEGTYTLGGTSNNFATYQDVLGQVYKTNPEGEGKVIVSSDTLVNALSGTFNFVAIRSGLDTLTISNGIFFEIPYSDSSGNDVGTLTAEVDGTPFIPFTISATNTGNSIVIIGSANSNSITIGVPVDVTSGSYEIPAAGFIASYGVDQLTENAVEGTIIIVEHDTANKTIKGTFSFKTASYIISVGQFNVTYQ